MPAGGGDGAAKRHAHLRALRRPAGSGRAAKIAAGRAHGARYTKTWTGAMRAKGGNAVQHSVGGGVGALLGGGRREEGSDTHHIQTRCSVPGGCASAVAAAAPA